MNRIRTHLCEHAFRVENYGEDYRWVVRCRSCGHSENWTQGEWRSRQRQSAPAELLTVSSESDRLDNELFGA